MHSVLTGLGKPQELSPAVFHGSVRKGTKRKGVDMVSSSCRIEAVRMLRGRATPLAAIEISYNS